MDARDFVRRVWQTEHRLTSASGSMPEPVNRLVLVNHRDWVDLVTDTWIGAPECPIQQPNIGDSLWRVYGVAIQTNNDVPVGSIRYVVHMEVEA
jgi:hypothetical protein